MDKIVCLHTTGDRRRTFNFIYERFTGDFCVLPKRWSSLNMMLCNVLGSVVALSKTESSQVGFRYHFLSNYLRFLYEKINVVVSF